MLNIAFPICNGIALVLLVIASPWHLRTRNSGTLLFLFWSFASIIPTFVNSIIWYKNTRVVATVWCDITTKLLVGASVGFPAAVLCITRQLESIAAARRVVTSPADRRRKTLIDCLIGLGIPILIMILHVIVQGHRFDIFEGAGCRPTSYWSYPAIFIVLLPPIALCLAAATYAGLAIRLFVVRRHQFAKVLESSTSAISTSRFIRLIALAAVQIAYSTPVTILILVGNILAFPPQPYTSWSDVHYQFGTIVQTSARDTASLPAFYQIVSDLTYWSYIVSCVAFFVFFGLGEEAVNTYKLAWRALLKRFIASKTEETVAIDPTGSKGSLSFTLFDDRNQSGKCVEDHGKSDGIGIMVTVHNDRSHV